MPFIYIYVNIGYSCSKGVPALRHYNLIIANHTLYIQNSYNYF